MTKVSHRTGGLAPPVTRLSYPAACPLRQCQCLQLSPRHPAPFLTPQQPTCADSVTPFISERPGMWICTTSELTGLSMSPWNPFSCRPTTRPLAGLGLDWVESGMSPASARRSRASQISPARSFSSLFETGDLERGVSPVVFWQPGVCPLSPLAKGHRADAEACVVSSLSAAGCPPSFLGSCLNIAISSGGSKEHHDVPPRDTESHNAAGAPSDCYIPVHPLWRF